MKTVINVAAIMLFSWATIQTHGPDQPQSVRTLTLDDILACAGSPTMKFLDQSDEQLRANSTKTDGQLNYFGRQVAIRWSGDGQNAYAESFSETDFCGFGSLKFVDVPQNGKNLRVVGSIHRWSRGIYSLSLQEVYRGNHPFLQEQGVFTNSSKHFLTITMEPVQCDIKAAEDGGTFKTITRIWKSKVGVSVQWEEGKHKDEWVFSRAMYDSPGCD